MKHCPSGAVRRGAAQSRRSRLALALATLAVTPCVSAIELDTGNPDWKLRWDNTVKYSLTGRLNTALPELSSALPLAANQNEDAFAALGRALALRPAHPEALTLLAWA